MTVSNCLRARARFGSLTRLLCFVAFCWSANSALASSARCSTTDDGSFPCRFRAMGRDGSFEISAPGKPTYVLNVQEPGVAFGLVNFGSRNVALPGRYLRSSREPSCWANDSTGTKICARR